MFGLLKPLSGGFLCKVLTTLSCLRCLITQLWDKTETVSRKVRDSSSVPLGVGWERQSQDSPGKDPPAGLEGQAGLDSQRLWAASGEPPAGPEGQAGLDRQRLRAASGEQRCLLVPDAHGRPCRSSTSHEMWDHSGDCGPHCSARSPGDEGTRVLGLRWCRWHIM